MKLRTALLTSAAVLFAGQAMAADITSPFYLPETGKMLSDTSVETSRFKLNDTGVLPGSAGKSVRAQETVYYGINDNWAAIATLGNEFNANKDFNNQHNFDYTVGTAYNYNMDQLLTQFGAYYHTMQPSSWVTDASNSWQGLMELNAKVGYELGCADFIPYIDFSAVRSIKGDELAQGTRWSYSTFAGAHKMWDATSADLGVRWDNVRERQEDKRNDVYAEGKFNYFLSDEMTVGVYGQYLIGDSEMGHIDYGYNVGANFKVLF